MNNLEISFIILLIILIYFMSDISNYIKNSKYVYIELFQNSQSEEEQDNNTIDDEDVVVDDDTPDEEIDDENEITITTKNTDTHTSKTATETALPEPSFTKSSNGFELLSTNFDGNINLYSPRVNKQL